MKRTDKEKTINPNFGDIFKRLYAEEKDRRKQKLSFGIVASELEVSKQTVSSYYSGDRTPKYEQIRKMKDKFHTSYERIFGESESNKLEYDDVVTNLGLHTDAIEKLEKYKLGLSYEGRDIIPYHMTPDLFFFALNKLILDYPNILMMIGNLLTYPTKDNKYITHDAQKVLIDEDKKPIDMKFLSYMITRELEKAQQEIGSSEAIAQFSEDKLKVHQDLAKEREEFEQNNKEYIEERDRILRMIDIENNK